MTETKTTANHFLVAPSFLFRLAVPCRQVKELWPTQLKPLSESYALPTFCELDGQQPFADVRVGWNLEGLRISLRVEGKRQPPWCRANRLEDSDGLRLWIDTRDTHNIHRAGRFCHQFLFSPSGGGRRLDEPVAEQLLINRARENARPVAPNILQVRSEKRVDGYLLEALVPATALTGFDPQEHPQLGFMYELVDRERGSQMLACSSEFPVREDPSLWATLELLRS